MAVAHPGRGLSVTVYIFDTMTGDQDSSASVSATDELPAGTVRAKFSEVVGRAQHAGTATYITSHGRRVAAVVPVEALEALERLEDEALSMMAREAKADPGPSVPHSEVLAELGL